MADFPYVGPIDDHSYSQQIKDNSGDVTLSGNNEQAVGANAATSSDNLDEMFRCPHCDKPYSTNKGLARHIKSKGSDCWKRRRLLEGGAVEQSQWRCSRCDKIVATKATLDRHIKLACWKKCDECAANRASNCDSLSRDGPCRTCSAQGRSCTKRSGLEHQSQESSTGGEPSAVSDHKRKPSANPTTNLAEGHKDKRTTADGLSVASSDAMQSLDSFDFHTSVPPQVEHPNTPVVATSVVHEQVRNLPVQATQADSAYTRHDEQVFPPRVPDQRLPAPTSILPSQRIDGTSTANHSLYGPLTSQPPNRQPTRSRAPASPLPLASELPPVVPFGRLPQFSPTLLAQAQQTHQASRMQYQDPIEAHPWFQSVVQENFRVKNVLVSQQHLIMFRDSQIEDLKAQLHEAEEVVRQVSELPAVKRVMEKSQAEAREKLNLNAAEASNHAESQHAAQHVTHPRSPSVMTPSAFIAKCEAVRDDGHVSSLLREPAVPFRPLASQSFPEHQSSFPEHAGQFNLDDASLFHDFAQFCNTAEEEPGNSAVEGFGDPVKEEFGNATQEAFGNPAEQEFESQTVANSDED